MIDSILIAFGHKAKRGKDTAVQAIIDARGKTFNIKRYAFADELKYEVYDRLCSQDKEFQGILDASGTSFLSSYVPPKGVSPEDKLKFINENKDILRPLLQYYGTEYRRETDPFYWIKKVDGLIRADRPQVALVADMRFLNEMLWVKAEGGDTIRVDREGYIDPPTNGVAHVSENELDDINFAVYDFEINVKDGDLAGLKSDAVGVFDIIINYHRQFPHNFSFDPSEVGPNDKTETPNAG